MQGRASGGFLTRDCWEIHRASQVYGPVNGVTLAGMIVLLIVAAAAALWCLGPIPIAVAVGRSFRAGEVETTFDQIVRDYDAAGV